jgi:5-methylcytosine-specific restriction endonuclease McrA
MTDERLPYIPVQYLLRIAERDQWTCHICHQGYRPGDLWKWRIDHDEALSKGGRNLVSNLRLAHLICNNGKGNA